ncbi:concanavalin A-like lectin/glucanase domain-containing protein [Lasiosphaeria hispida]|uniref:Concanavalin A-like lectin/glucanase domain-containing protein n=1 Tax=Lasiosphaeria hispida TaxID=260671 RepID=A0AAJ0MDU2_9PEZI|nr:concanavalin A-like lectin/glucanase domain-containing protein [Lasiosphaeria hispida]
MHFVHLTFLVALLPTLASAWDPPSYDGYGIQWADSFGGASGSLPNQNNWNIIDGNLGVNNELQTYRANPHQVQTSGGSTLQLVPWRDGSVSGGWTSGRIESKYTFTPQAGRRTMAEAQLRFGPGPVDAKKGIWPAFWLLGDSIRHFGGWPACGELDVMETVNGLLTGYGTAHCDVSPGGACNEPTGRGATVGIPNQDFQRWRIVWDRTAGSWQGESVTWFFNDQQFHQIRGDQMGSPDVWASLAQRPMFFILNVAVGGNWPGYPDGNTRDGYGSMMEVGYVALYTSGQGRGASQQQSPLDTLGS